MAFLKDRKMVVKHRGGRSNIKSLAGNSFSLKLLFIVMINDLGFEGQENNASELVTCNVNMPK